MRNYIPVKKYWFEMYTKYDRPYWIPALKFPIEKIKIDKSLFGYHNEVSHSNVLYMLMNFDRDARMPITINKNYYLLDGQHRLELARQMGLSFIDVVIEDSELLKGNNKNDKKESEGKKKGSKKVRRLESKLKTLKAEIMKREAKMSGEVGFYD